MTNSAKTFLLLLVLGTALPLCGYFAAGMAGMIAGAVVATVWLGGALLFADRFLLRLYDARPLSFVETPGLYRAARRLSRAGGTPMPSLWLIPERAPNAMAIGCGSRHVIAFTEGLIQQLTACEIEAVIAQRLAHLKQRDAHLSSFTATLAGTASAMAHFLMWGTLASSTESARPQGRFAKAWNKMFVRFTRRWSRWCMPQSSFLKADGLAAQWTGSPLALASALNKLVAGTASPTYSGGPHTSHLFAVDPWLHESAPDGLKKRILELESLTGWQHRAA